MNVPLGHVQTTPRQVGPMTEAEISEIIREHIPVVFENTDANFFIHNHQRTLSPLLSMWKARQAKDDLCSD